MRHRVVNRDVRLEIDHTLDAAGFASVSPCGRGSYDLRQFEFTVAPAFVKGRKCFVRWTRGPMVKVLIDAADIDRQVRKLGQQLADDYRGRPLTVLGVLTGSIILISDLIRQIDLPLRVGLIQASSYRGRTTSAGELDINPSLLPDIADRDVVLIDDIFDTGKTLEGLLEVVAEYRPQSLRSAVLLWKQGRSQVEVEPDYHCFQIPDRFVVGYGLDYNDDYRHLPYIAALEPSDL